MLQRLRSLIFSVAATLGIMMSLGFASSVSAAACSGQVTSNADICNNVCGGTTLNISDTGNTQGGCAATSGSTTQANTLLKNIINILSIVVGIIAVIMIIIGGFRYITSGGQSEKITSAKNTILYALVGL